MKKHQSDLIQASWPAIADALNTLPEPVAAVAKQAIQEALKEYQHQYDRGQKGAAARLAKNIAPFEDLHNRLPPTGTHSHKVLAMQHRCASQGLTSPSSDTASSYIKKLGNTPASYPNLSPLVAHHSS
jgi:hypothetical protein